MDKKIGLPYILVSVSGKERSGLHQGGCRSRQHAACKTVTILKSDQQMGCLFLASMCAGDATISSTESPDRIMAKCPCYGRLLRCIFKSSLVLKYSSFQDLRSTASIISNLACVAVAKSKLHSLFSFICVSYAYTYTDLCQQHKSELNNKNRS